MGILRTLSYAISSALYSLIPGLYDIFYRLASAKFFKRSEIMDLSGNIYVVVSACMLFALGIRLLGAIVNPDSFNDNKKGAKRTFINCLIGVVLIAVVPFAFRAAYVAQNTLLQDNLISQLILGVEIDDNDSVGEILAKQSFGIFCYPNEGRVSTDTNSDWDILLDDFNSQNLSNFGDHIRDENDDWWEIEYHVILSPLFGGYMVYQMILLCLDIATRTIRLILLEIMAPLVICGFIFSGTELLQRWFKDVLSTYIIVFTKVVGIVFTIFGISKIFSVIQTDETFDGIGLIGQGFAKAAIVIALLTIVKQLPTIINTIFGTNIKEQDGIRGRLGNMAGIGGIAQQAWDNFRHHPIQSTRRVISAPVSAVGGAVANNVAAIRRANSEFMRGHVFRGVGAILGGMAGSGGAAARAGRTGWQNGNLQGIGQAGTRYEQTHPEGSTLVGRTADRVTSFLGVGTRIDRQAESDTVINMDSGDYRDNVSFQNARRRLGLNDRGSISVDEVTQMNKGFTEAQERYNAIAKASNDIVERTDSNIVMDSGINIGDLHVGAGNYASMLQAIRNADGIDADTLRQAEDRLEEMRHEAVNYIRDDVLAGRARLDEDGRAMRFQAGSHYADVEIDVNDANDMTLNRDILQSVNGVVINSRDTFNHNRSENQQNVNATVNILQTHSAIISARENTDTQRNRRADHNAINAGNNNSGGNNGGH